MKILFCTTVYEEIGVGPAKFANLITYLNQNTSGVDIHILSEDISSPSTKLHKLDLKIPFILLPIGFLYRMIPYYNKALELHQEEKFDVIWFNNVLTGYRTARRLKSIPVIGMINDDNSVLASYKTLGFGKKLIRHLIFRFYESRSHKYYVRIIVNSKYLKKLLEKRYKISPSKLSILYKSVNLETDPVILNRSTEISKREAIKILFVKSDFIRGGLFNLVNALSLLPYIFILTIVGPPITVLEKIFDSISLASNIEVIFLGRQQQKTIFQLLLQNHIFCTPSKQEALGVANMEAMIHRIPIVYTNVGGIPEVMNNGNNGFEAGYNDIHSLAKAIEKCIENKGERNQKVDNALTFVRTFFSKEVMLENFMKISKSVLSTIN